MINRTRYTKLTVPIDIVFLILEDSSLFQMQILIELKKMGFPGATVLVTSSVKEAMTIIETEKIDFIFTDHHLPDGSGIQFIGARGSFVLFFIKAPFDCTNYSLTTGIYIYMFNHHLLLSFLAVFCQCLHLL